MIAVTFEVVAVATSEAAGEEAVTAVTMVVVEEEEVAAMMAETEAEGAFVGAIEEGSAATGAVVEVDLEVVEEALSSGKCPCFKPGLHLTIIATVSMSLNPMPKSRNSRTPWSKVT